jgi:hypothetical protein
MGNKSLSLTLCLALLTAAVPGYPLSACDGKSVHANVCRCRGECRCVHTPAPMGQMSKTGRGPSHESACASCIRGNPPADHFGLLPFLYRGTNECDGGVETIFVPPATPDIPGMRVGLRQNGFADQDVFLRECAFLS